MFERIEADPMLFINCHNIFETLQLKYVLEK